MKFCKVKNYSKEVRGANKYVNLRFFDCCLMLFEIKEILNN